MRTPHFYATIERHSTDSWVKVLLEAISTCISILGCLMICRWGRQPHCCVPEQEQHFIRSMHIVYLRNFNTQVVLLLDGFICVDPLLAGVVANGKRENIVSCVWTLWWNQSWTVSDISVKVRIGWYIFHMGGLYILSIPDISNFFTQPPFEAKKFYTWMCVNLQQNSW